VVAILGWLVLTVVSTYLYYWVPGITGQTPGKRLMGIEVVDATTGQYIGGWTSVARTFLSIINAMPLYLGWLWPLFDDRKQTFADKVVNSVVINCEKGKVLPLFPNGKPF